MLLTTLLSCLLASASLAAPVVSDEAATAAKASRFKFYDMLTPAAGPCDLCTGPDGALWGEDIFADIIFRIDPVTDKVEEYPIPWTGKKGSFDQLPTLASRTVLACAIRPGADGNIYASQGIRNQMVQVNVTTKEIKVFTPPNASPLGDLQFFNDFTTNATGMFFSQTTANLVTYFDYSTEKFTSYPVPGSPLGMIVASDNNLYVAELLGNAIHRLNPQTGKTKTFPLPLQLLGPAVVRAETHNRYVWFTAFLGGGLGRLDTKTGTIEAHSNPSLLSFPAEDTLDSRGNIWFSTATQNTLNKYSPRDNTFSTVVQPNTTIVAPISLPLYFDIGINYSPGNAIWFTEATTNRVGRYQLA